MNGQNTLALTLFTIAGALAVMQVVPYGRDHTNPPDGQAVAWDSPTTRDLAQRACFDCHSNRTKWPWYASIAPLSWRIQNHVTAGREAIDFTAFAADQKDVAEAAGEAGEQVVKGEMPPADYRLMHPEARLTPSEKRALAAGLDRTFSAFMESGDGASRGGEARTGGAAAAESERDED